MKLNPKDKGAPTGGGTNMGPGPGRKGLAIVWFTRKVGAKSGKEYLSVKIEVTHGPEKGRTFYTMLGLDLSKRGTALRWNLLCETFGIEEEFELGSIEEGTAMEGDANIQKLLKNRGFVGDLSVTTENGFTNVSVDRIVPRRQWQAADIIGIEKWEADAEAARGNYGLPPDDDDGGGISEEEIENQASAQWPTDDDIPF